jgi:hypothetical protein
MTQTQQQERRLLNEGIEAAFLDTATHAAGIETHYQCGRGAIMEVYENFFFHFNILHKLTSGREEMKQSEKVSIKIQGWFREKMPDSSSMKDRCYEGINLFDEYHTALSSNGLLSLPSRGR